MCSDYLTAGIEKCVVPVRGNRAKEDNPVIESLLYEYPDDFIGMASITLPGKVLRISIAFIVIFLQFIS